MTPAPILRFDVPLRDHTTFGIGGPAQLFADVRSSGQLLRALRWARRERLPHVVLGGGSNVLAADAGFPGLVIRNARSDRIELFADGRVLADSGVPLPQLIAFTVARGLSGLEHFAGVPATLGGALRQNLHFLNADRSRLLFVGDLLESATVLVDESVERVGHDWFEFGHDARRLRDSNAIVLDATLRLQAAPESVLRARVQANLGWRASRHPPGATRRSAGCIFRNSHAASAARTIESAGLKGLRIGGAVVSSRHANFILNDAGASAADVSTLMHLVSERVRAEAGVVLEPEIRLICRHKAGSAGESAPIETAPFPGLFP